jgi:hypothetical protein
LTVKIAILRTDVERDCISARRTAIFGAQRAVNLGAMRRASAKVPLRH